MVSSNFDDELSIINQTLPTISDEAGNTAADALTLCTQSTCTQHTTRPGWVTSTVLGKVTHSQDQDWYQLTASATVEPLLLQLAVHANWRQRAGQKKEAVWRVSNLRLDLRFDDKAVKVLGTTDVGMLTSQQNFTVTLPPLKPGTYTFSVRPTAMLDRGANVSLPTVYGNLGSYELTVQWPFAGAGS